MNEQQTHSFAHQFRRALCIGLSLWAVACGSGNEESTNDVGSSSQVAQPLGLGQPGGGFSGTARAVYPALGSSVLPLPDVTFYAKDAISGVNSATVSSDLFGRFSIPPQAPGFYKVCWKKKNFVSQCGATVYHVTSGDVNVDYVSVLPVDAPPLRLRGKVKLADGGLCFDQDKFFGVELTARLDVIQGDTVLVSGRANNEGEFLLAGIPLADAQLRVRCGNAQLVVPIANLDLTGGNANTFVIANSRPFVQPISAESGGDARAGVAPSTVVRLTAVATDPDGDSLKYHWKAPQGSGTLVDTLTTAASWKLPKSPGTFYAYLLADDGKGGVVTRRVGVRVHGVDTSVVFSGTVIGDFTRAPIQGADITVGTATAKTDGNGYFALTIPQQSSYVLGIEKVGFAEFSKKLLNPARGQTYALTETFKVAINPATDNIIEDKRPRWLEGGPTRRGGAAGAYCCRPTRLCSTPRR